MYFGIMQGRLSKTKKNVLQYLPKNWTREFQILKGLDLDFIELFTSRLNDQSPIWRSDKSILKKKISETKFKKIILCDNFALKKNPLTENYRIYFNKIINHLSKFKNPMLIVPLNNYLFKANNYEKLLLKVNHFIKISKVNNVALSFEVQVPLLKILKFKKDLNNKFFKITFDTGNIYQIEKSTDSLIKYLERTKNFINHFHIKDRDIYGNNVVLGTGKIDFRIFFKSLKKTNYKKALTFETNRGKNCVLTAKENLKFTKNKLN